MREEFILAASATMLAAFCIWLTVRIINLRERWAKRTAVVTAGLVLYILSFGPAWWLANRCRWCYPGYCAVYWPVGFVAGVSPKPINAAIRRYVRVFGESFGPSPVSLPFSARGDVFNP